MPIPLPLLIRSTRNILKSQYRINKTQLYESHDITYIIKILNTLYQDVIPVITSTPIIESITSCQVCYSDWDEQTKPITMRTCGHACICMTCFQQYVSMKVEDNDTLYIRCPYPNCTHAIDTQDVMLAFPAITQYMQQKQYKCVKRSTTSSISITVTLKESTTTSRSIKITSKHKSSTSASKRKPSTSSKTTETSSRISKRSRKKLRSGKKRHSVDIVISETKSECEEPDVVMESSSQHTSPQQQHDSTTAITQLLSIYQLTATIASKLLARHRDWIPCCQSTCLFGFYFTSQDHDGDRICGVCTTQQHVTRPVLEMDDEVRRMIDQGIMRDCPICGEMQIKDRGMCNIMECGRCGIYWNWETKMTAKTSSELKEQSRNNGSLWQPGELQYQLELQRNDFSAFKALLARNGITYDPNYIRGT